jgi:hypothetical protein
MPVSRTTDQTTRGLDRAGHLPRGRALRDNFIAWCPRPPAGCDVGMVSLALPPLGGQISRRPGWMRIIAAQAFCTHCGQAASGGNDTRDAVTRRCCRHRSSATRQPRRPDWLDGDAAAAGVWTLYHEAPARPAARPRPPSSWPNPPQERRLTHWRGRLRWIQIAGDARSRFSCLPISLAERCEMQAVGGSIFWIDAAAAWPWRSSGRAGRRPRVSQ